VLTPATGRDTVDDAWFSTWRGRELRRVVRSGVAYLDYTGAALYPESLVRADARRLVGSVVGNPHSEHAPSRAASADLASARAALLAFLNAPPDEYTVVLTPNTSGACRIVGEGFPFRLGSTLLLPADNHNSVNGIREFARAGGASVRTVPLDAELRIADSLLVPLDESPAGPSLFAFPGQSNFSGVRHDLGLIARAQASGCRVLLDAAARLPTSDLDLAHYKPDYVAMSLYKIAGYPTGIGALVVRREALAELRRPWFSGGTVQWVSVQHGRHRLFDGPEGFEDGTPAFLAAAAVAPALEAICAPGRARLSRHLTALTSRLLTGLASLRHDNGLGMVQVHGPRDTHARGATVAISLRDRTGRSIPYWLVELAARDAGLAVRGGCFCNPGCAEAAFAFPDLETRACLDQLGAGFTIPRFASCLGDRTVGAIRISMGLGSIAADVDRFVGLAAVFADCRAAA
jgi:selenocysteine lyase/cysteine desulfurase